MPNAPTHDRIALVSGVLLIPLNASALLSLSIPPERIALDTALLVGTHLVCSYWLSPDLDIDSEIDNRWGPLRVIWLPYQMLIPHRHWFSHSGISALLRVLYLVLMINLIILIISVFIPGAPQNLLLWLGNVIQTHPREALFIALGAIISDLIHTISDRISTRIKRKRLLRRLYLRFGRRRRRAHRR